MENIYQALYRYRAVIGWLNSVEIIDEPITARVDKHSQVEIGSKFKEEHLKTIEDIAFILSHESAHKYIALLLASDFELNYWYSRLLSKGWTENYLQDLLINQSQFHAIQSNLPERYYDQTDNWTYLFLQRNLKPFARLTKLNEKQQNALDMFKLSCQQWYLQNELPQLFEVFKCACKFLDLFECPKDLPEKEQLVEHKEEEEECEECEPPSQVDNIPSHGGGKNLGEALLNIPYVSDFKVGMNWHLESLYKSLEKLSAAIDLLAKRISDAAGQHRTIGYSGPTEEELVNWSVGIFSPWTEALIAPQTKELVLIFDVSGSCFRYLALLHNLREILRDFDVHWYAFSSFISKIDFKLDHAEVKTGFGTDVTDIVQMLSKMDRTNVVIVSDAQWRLDIKQYSVEIAEKIFKKHHTTLLQIAYSDIRFLPSSCFREVIKL
jgi:hypothetical protein